MIGLMMAFWACQTTPKVEDSTSETSDETQDNAVGGPCEYNDYPGSCQVEEDLSVTYTGTIEGEVVTLQGNVGNGVSAGDTLDCTLSYITEGTCTPCVLDVGECGSDAFGHLQNLD